MAAGLAAPPLEGAPARVQRLRTRAQFQALLAYRPVARTAHFALHRLALPAERAPEAGLFGPAPASWLGAMVPKRWARRAVTRNAIRRQVYALGGAQPWPRPAARLVRLHTAFSPAQFPSAGSLALRRAVRAELRELLKREPA